MSLESSYIQARLNFLGLHLALAGEIPKRSGDFETTYKTKSGKEVSVNRSPDGKFASNSSTNAAINVSVSIGVEKTFVESLSDFGSAVAKFPDKVQWEIRKAVFKSDVKRAIDKGTEFFVKNIKDPLLLKGYELGRKIDAELAKKPFSEFGKTISEQFTQFKNTLPRKSEDLRKEIDRVFNDPNTSVSIATGVMLGLAGYFAFGAIGAGIGAARITFAAAVAAGEAGEIPALAVVFGSVPVLKQLTEGALNTVLAIILTSQAGKLILNNAKANAAAEKERLTTTVFSLKYTNPDDVSAYEELSKLSAREKVAHQKVAQELQNGISQIEENQVVRLRFQELMNLSREKGKRATLADQARTRILIHNDQRLRTLIDKFDQDRKTQAILLFSDQKNAEGDNYADQLKAINDRVTEIIETEKSKASE